MQLSGTNLLQHISDDTLRHLTEQLIDKPRKQAASICLPMRCDSPDVIREMLSPGDSGELRFVVKLLRSELREPVALLDLEAKTPVSFVGTIAKIEGISE